MLMLGLAFSVLGCALAAPGASTPDGVPFPRLTAGLVFVWSVGAPIVDVLAVSCFSVLSTKLVPRGRQAAIMGYISMAGSLGRIAYPLLFAPAGVSGTLAFSAVSCGLAMAGITALYTATDAGTMLGLQLCALLIPHMCQWHARA